MTPPDERPEPDLSGRRIGDYQLLRRLGRGGMADVYLAEQLSLRRQVALKVLQEEPRRRRRLYPPLSARGPGGGQAGACQHRADL